jgi:hypothetical protein
MFLPAVESNSRPPSIQMQPSLLVYSSVTKSIHDDQAFLVTRDGARSLGPRTNRPRLFSFGKIETGDADGGGIPSRLKRLGP